MESSNLPGILTIGIGDACPEDMIKLIIGEGSVVGTLWNNYSVYDWKIENKYYTADVHLHSPISKNMGLKTSAKVFEAIIFYVDLVTDDLIRELDDWIFLTDNSKLDVKILVFSHIIPDENNDLISEWCIRNGFESIELESSNDADDESIGISRVVEALHAHHWSSLKLKDERVSVITMDSVKVDNIEPLKRVGCCTSVPEASYGSTILRNTNPSTEAPFEQLDELSVLFRDLRFMQNEISALRGTEKLDKAEMVVKAFWNAVGGDSNEFSDSDNEGT